MAIAAVVVIGVTIAALALGERGNAPPAGDVVTPNIVGIPVDRARAVADGADLVLGPGIYRQADAYPEGTVISQTSGREPLSLSDPR